MKVFFLPMLLLGMFCLSDQPSPKTAPVVSKETVIKGPVDKDGFIDLQKVLNDRLGEGVTSEKNANSLLWKAFGPTPEGGKGLPDEYFKRIGIEKPPKEGDYLISSAKFFKDTLKGEQSDLQKYLDEISPLTKSPWKGEKYPQVLSWLKANEKPLALAKSACERSVYYNPLVPWPSGQFGGMLIGSLLPSVQKCRSIAELLSLRAMNYLGEGKYDEAWAEILTCHRLGRLVGQGGTLIEGLVGFAICQIANQLTVIYLDRTTLSEAQIKKCIRDLETLPRRRSTSSQIDLVERLSYIDIVQHIQRGHIDPEWLDYKKIDPTQLKALKKFDWPLIIQNGNRVYDRIIKVLAISDRTQRKAAIAELEKELRKLKKENQNREKIQDFIKNDSVDNKAISESLGNFLITMFLPAFLKVTQAEERMLQSETNLRIAFALALYRKEKGNYPEKLETLAPKYLATIPKDLFSGKDLKYQKIETGYLLYSVGVNEKDDSGRWYSDTPSGDDIKIQMPVPGSKK